MESLADVKELKPYQRKKRRRSRFWKMIILVLILVSVFLFVAFSEGWIDKDFLDTIVSKTQGYPVSVVGGKPKSIFNFNDKNIALLTDTNLIVYNEEGTILSQTEHNCTNPNIITQNNKLLVFDQGYNFFQIQDKNGAIYSNSVSNKLINAALADNGSYAVSTSSTRFLSEMFVYNKSNTEICHWKSVGSYISSMSFSKNSKKIVVASLFADSGYINSNIRIFDLNREEEPITLDTDYSDSSIVEVQYLNNGNILLIFDNCYIIINENGKTVEEYKFNANEKLYYHNVNKDGAIVIIKDANEKLICKRIFSNLENNTVKFTLEESSFKSLAFSDDYVFVLQNDKVQKYDNYGKKTTLIKNIPDTFDICEENGIIYTLNFTQIESYN